MDLSNLPNYTAYVRLLIDGHPSNPFSLRTLPPGPTNFDEQRAEIVRRVSRRQFGPPVREVAVEIEQPFAGARS